MVREPPLLSRETAPLVVSWRLTVLPSPVIVISSVPVAPLVVSRWAA